MEQSSDCRVCQRPDAVAGHPNLPPDDYVVQRCRTCGEFRYLTADRYLLDQLPHESRYILSGVLREATIAGLGPMTITRDNFDSLCSEGRLPPTIMDRLERLLRLIESRTGRLGASVEFRLKDEIAVPFARDMDELSYMIDLMEKRAHLAVLDRTRKDRYGEEERPVLQVRIEPQGWYWLDELRRNRPEEGDRVFVAMRFSEEMNAFWDLGFRAGCSEAGYQAIRIDKLPHNEPWIDRIMALIRESRFVVADLSDRVANSGVGFEAGFARGLGLEVIFTCKDSKWSAADSNSAEAARYGPLVHANFKQFTVLRWKDANDLREQVRDRILGTVGRHKGR